MTNRYTAYGIEAEYEPGSNGLVLRNKLRITEPEEMDELEAVLLEKLYQLVLIDDFRERALTTADLQRWHRQWLGNVYPWAGELRSVNLGKADIQFAAAAQIPRLLAELETQFLQRFTPCHGLRHEELVNALAVTHVELILIHPFREGNGRLARLLADAMAVQAGMGPLDYSSWDANRTRYFAAIQHGLAQDYAPMTELMRKALFP
jgi:cell filamentation protein